MTIDERIERLVEQQEKKRVLLANILENIQWLKEFESRRGNKQHR